MRVMEQGSSKLVDAGERKTSLSAVVISTAEAIPAPGRNEAETASSTVD
jgi:hypothetical protein